MQLPSPANVSLLSMSTKAVVTSVAPQLVVNVTLEGVLPANLMLISFGTKLINTTTVFAMLTSSVSTQNACAFPQSLLHSITTTLS